MKTKVKKSILIVLSCMLMFGIFNLHGCNNKSSENNSILNTLINSNFSQISPYSNQVKHYCMINGKHYFDLNVMSEDGTMDKIADNIPCGNPFNSLINGIATDGEFLYCHACNLQTKEELQNHMKYGLYKIDINKNEIIPLYEWETQSGISNNYSITFINDYIYFFVSTDNTNNICRIKKDGSDFQKLTNNKDQQIYTGIFLIDDIVYYHKNGNIYVTTLDNMDGGELVYENVYTIELYKEYFYFTTYNNENAFFRMKIGEPNSVEKIINDMCSDFYVIKDDIIYYAKYDPIVLESNSQGLKTINSTQGQIYSYDINTKSNNMVFQNNNIDYNRIYNVSDKAIIAVANTNEQLIEASEQGGVSINYYIIPLDETPEHYIQDLTLKLAGK